MHATSLGADGPRVSVAGLGCGAISGLYGPPDHAAGVATLEAALAAGVTLWDLADFYGMGAGEMLIGEFLRGRRREDVVLSVKYGGQRDPSGKWLGHDITPAATKTALAYTLTRLGTDYVDVYRPSRVDPDVPIEEVVGAIGEMVDAGYIRHIALSEAGAETIRRAHAERPICDVQMEYSLISRSIERAILPTCRELGIAVTAYGVLSRGLLSGHWTADRRVSPADMRAHAPRFQGDNLERNLALVEALRELAATRGCTVAQLAIAWVASRGADIVPLIGVRSPEQLHEGLGGLELALSVDELAEIERAVPASSAAGPRYPAWQLATLDSER